MNLRFPAVPQLDFSAVRRVIVYRLGSLGDFVVALPSLHLIARSFPNAERVLLTNLPVSEKAPAASAVIGNSGLIHSYLVYPVRTRNPIRLVRLWTHLVRYSPDVFVYLMAVPGTGEREIRRNITFFRSTGIRNFVGLSDESNLINQRDPTTGLFEPESSRLARTLQSLGDANLDDPASWDLRLTTEEQDAAESRLQHFGERPFIACSIGTKAQANDWTLPNWTNMLTKLSVDRSNFGLLLIGAANERTACDQLAAVWKGPTMNVCGDFTPRETAAALTKARLFIGHDSGPLHLAASVQVPCVGIYSARNLPGVWFPHGNHRIMYRSVDCMGCGLVTCIEQKKKCILSITAEDVLNEVNSLSSMLPVKVP